MLTIDKQAIVVSLNDPNTTPSDRTKLLERQVTISHILHSSVTLFSFQEKLDQKLESTQLWVTLFHPT